MPNLFFSLVLFNHDFDEISELISSINKFSISFKSKFKTKLCIYENSPQKKINKEVLISKYPLLKISYSHDPTNKGFGYGHNRNLLDLTIEDGIFIIINPDIKFQIDDIKDYFNWFLMEKEVLCSAPLIFNKGGKIQYSAKKNPTLLALFCSRLGLNNFWGISSYMIWHQNRKYDYAKNFINAPFLSGCFLLIDPYTYKKISGFDENYFLHMEDADLVRRISKIGKTLHAPIGKVFHSWSRGSHKSFKQTFALLRSMILYFNKWGWKFF